MSSRAIKPKREPAAKGAGWTSIEERAPSVMREEGPQFPRYVAIISLMLVTLGGAAILFGALKKAYLIAPGFGFVLFSIGVAGLLYHAFYERDFQFRRIYGLLGGLLLVTAVALRIMPMGTPRVVGGGFLNYGAGPLCAFLSLGFLLCFIRNEDESVLRIRVVYLIGILAALNSLVGFIGGAISENFLLSTGILHMIIGLLFGAAFVGIEGLNTPRGYRAGLAIGLLGLAMFLFALGRSTIPYILFNLNWADRPPVAFFLPSGLILMYIGAEYLILGLGICSDNKVVVLTRRELGSFFFSPIAYIVLIGMAAIGWLNFLIFLRGVFGEESGMGGLPEPIVQRFFVSFLALIPLMFLVPVVTMRLLSEEKRSGSLEVLLTAPVNEWQVVLAKFFAGLRVFMLCWYSWAVFFIAFRIEGGKEFDYRPLITFVIALFCMGAGFVAMGLFFSSLTRHQVLAAVFTFVVMFTSTLLFILTLQFPEIEWFVTISSYVSYVELWVSSARGTITPRFLVLHLAMAVFWLFLTIKVLEARKWS